MVTLLFSNRDLHLSGVRLSVDLRTDMCSKGIILRAQNLLTILGSIVNMIGGPT